MKFVVKFRVVSPILGVRPTPCRERLVQLPEGAIIATSADLQEPGLVTVTLNGEDLMVFTRDIQDRMERIEVGDEHQRDGEEVQSQTA